MAREQSVSEWNERKRFYERQHGEHLPQISFITKGEWMRAEKTFCNRDKEILRVHKYGPVDDVYRLACFIHNGDLWLAEERSDAYEWIPDDLAVLIAHALLVMGNEARADALRAIRRVDMEERQPEFDFAYVQMWNRLRYEADIKAIREREEQEIDDAIMEEISRQEDRDEDYSESNRW